MNPIPSFPPSTGNPLTCFSSSFKTTSKKSPKKILIDSCLSLTTWEVVVRDLSLHSAPDSNHAAYIFLL